jgi:hypothetical protein
MEPAGHYTIRQMDGQTVSMPESAESMIVSDAKLWIEQNLSFKTYCQILFAVETEEPLKNGEVLSEDLLRDRTLYLFVRPEFELLSCSAAHYDRAPGAGSIQSIMPPGSGWMCTPGGSFCQTLGQAKPARAGVITLTFSNLVDIGAVILLAENQNCARSFSLTSSTQTCVIEGNPRTLAKDWAAATGIVLEETFRNVAELKIEILQNHKDSYCGINEIRLYGWIQS